MREPGQEGEPDYMIVLDRIYQKDAAVAVPQRISSLDRLEYNERMEMQAELRELPEETILSVPSLTEIERFRAMKSLLKLGLVEETDHITGLPLTLIDVDLDHVAYIRLTEKGFEVAHDRGIRQRQQEILEEQNKSSHLLAAVTILLAVTAVVQAITDVLSLSWPLNIVLGIFYSMVLLVLVWKRDEWYRLLTQALV